MNPFIAKSGDAIQGTDVHTVVNSATSETQPQSFPFSGAFIPATLEAKVKVNEMAVATINSQAENQPAHMPPPSYTFSDPPTNLGQLSSCTIKVKVNGKNVARDGDSCTTCTEGDQNAQVQVRQKVKVCVGS
jgi:uncharacterized Zn-binding protein involved in type VI secretion